MQGCVSMVMPLDANCTTNWLGIFIQTQHAIQQTEPSHFQAHLLGTAGHKISTIVDMRSSGHYEYFFAHLLIYVGIA